MSDHSFIRKILELPANCTSAEAHGLLVAINDSLEEGGLLREADPDPGFAVQLSMWIATHVMPGREFSASANEITDDGQSDNATPSQLRSAYRAGFSAMAKIDQDYPKAASVFPVLLCLLAFSDGRDPWNSETTCKTALSLIDKHREELLREDFLDHALKSFIRRLFAKSRPATVTAQGRKAVNAEFSPSSGSNSLDEESKPWKFEETSAKTVFSWILQNVESSFFAPNWPLLIPPLLTLLDDGSTDVRLRGLELLKVLAAKAPAKLLEQTGLVEVFEDAVRPTLLFLPNLTPVGESLSLLGAAYEALFALVRARFGAGPKEWRADEQQERRRFLGRMLVDGVIKGYRHSPEVPQIVELELRIAGDIIEELRLFAVLYLKVLVPMLSEVLSDPFATSHVKLVNQALRTTQTLILNCWPRLGREPCRNELMKAFITCWYSLDGEDYAPPSDRALYHDIVSTREVLKKAARMLIATCEEQVDVMAELAPVFQADPNLKSLFAD